MPVTYTYPYLQYGGLWTASQQADAKAAGTWPVPPALKLYAWGRNATGQLGLGDTTNRSSPTQIGSLTNWLSISASYTYTAAVKTDGTLWSWGYNNFGQLGLGDTTSRSSPVQIGALTSWLSVSCGYAHTMAISTNGSLWSWGFNSFGQLGLGNQTYYSSPKQVGSLTNWATVSASSESCLAIKTDGTLWAWGNNSAAGTLGLGNTTNYSSPKQVGSLTNWSKVSCGAYFAVAIKTDGTLWGWGQNSAGQLGLNNTTYSFSSPQQIGALTNWSKLANGPQCSASIKTDGTLWTWGLGSIGQLGHGNTTSYSSPKQVGALTNWLLISSGYNHMASIKTDGTLWTWGNGSQGRLGLGNVTPYSSPKQVGSLTTWTTLFGGWRAGSSFGIALN